MNGDRPPLLEAIAARFAALPQVVALALAGSRTAGAADADSDLDLYVYARRAIPAARRAAIARAFADRAEIDNQFWEPGDEWIDAASGRGVDVMYRTPRWIEDQLDRLLVRHEASVGYSTCFWHNVLTSEPLVDPTGWFAALQARARQPYPEPLRRAIVAKNHPILRRTISSFAHQLELALARDDRVSVQHRLTAILASYFDILFAVNRLPHPGEKRLVSWAGQHCARTPPGTAARIDAVLAAAAPERPATDLLGAVDALLDGLDAVLAAEGLLPSTAR